MEGLTEVRGNGIKQPSHILPRLANILFCVRTHGLEESLKEDLERGEVLVEGRRL